MEKEELAVDDINKSEIPTTGSSKTLGMRVPLEKYHLLLKMSMDKGVNISDILYYKVFLEDKKTEETKLKNIELETKISELNKLLALEKTKSLSSMSDSKKKISDITATNSKHVELCKTLSDRLAKANAYIKENVFGSKQF